MTEKRFFELVGEAHFYTFAEVKDGVSLSTAESMATQQRVWADGDPSKEIDFSTAPYWLTTDDGQDPTPIAELEDICKALGERWGVQA